MAHILGRSLIVVMCFLLDPILPAMQELRSLELSVVLCMLGVLAVMVEGSQPREEGGHRAPVGGGVRQARCNDTVLSRVVPRVSAEAVISPV